MRMTTTIDMINGRRLVEGIARAQQRPLRGCRKTPGEVRKNPRYDEEAVDNSVGNACTKRGRQKSLFGPFFRCVRPRFVENRLHEVRGTSARELVRSAEAVTGAAARRISGYFGTPGPARRAPRSLASSEAGAPLGARKARAPPSNASAEAA
jgi:hypothetical protein